MRVLGYGLPNRAKLLLSPKTFDGVVKPFVIHIEHNAAPRNWLGCASVTDHMISISPSWVEYFANEVNLMSNHAEVSFCKNCLKGVMP